MATTIASIEKMFQPTDNPMNLKVNDDLDDLNADQQTAAETLLGAIRHGVFLTLLLGAAGTGKTYTITRLLRILHVEREVILSAPTHKAATVLRQMAVEIGGAEAVTIHSLLGLRPEQNLTNGRMVLQRFRPPEIPKRALVVVDECSMVNRELYEQILEHGGKAHAQILFVGDPSQLPPVFEKESLTFSTQTHARLTRIVRQAEDHPILSLTQQLREAQAGGDMPVFKTHRTDRAALLLLNSKDFADKLGATFASPLYESDPNHCRVLTWTNGRTHDYNGLIRRHLLGNKADNCEFLEGEKMLVCQPIIEDNKVFAAVGDLVQVMKATLTTYCAEASNDVQQSDLTSIPVWDLDVAIGDSVIRVQQVQRTHGSPLYKACMGQRAKYAQALQKDYSENPTPQRDRERRKAWRAFFLLKDAMADLRPAHASTIHRSQGSTYDHVFIDLTDIGRNTKRRETLQLLYVALTRARYNVIVTGDLPARLYEYENEKAHPTVSSSTGGHHHLKPIENHVSRMTHNDSQGI